MDRASSAFFNAIFKPRTCDVIRSAIAEPATSSCAVLILDPVAKRSIAVDAALVFSSSILCALRDDRFVFTIMGVPEKLHKPANYCRSIGNRLPP